MISMNNLEVINKSGNQVTKTIDIKLKSYICSRIILS